LKFASQLNSVHRIGRNQQSNHKAKFNLLVKFMPLMVLFAVTITEGNKKLRIGKLIKTGGKDRAVQ
jgi:hypothetical protein